MSHKVVEALSSLSFS